MANVEGIPVWREVGATPLPRAPWPERQKIVVVGAGPIGLTVALDLGRRGHDVLVLNKLDFVPAGSKSICIAKRSLEIFDRLGIGQDMVDEGVVWNVGKVFWGAQAEPIYQFDLLPDKHQRRPAFINIQQFHVEDRLIDALRSLANVTLRWGHEVSGVESRDEHVMLDVTTADGGYAIKTDWLIACDGVHSTVRAALGLDFEGRAFSDNFLIADIEMRAERPSERWFWFDPPFNPGRSALLHKQPDNVWRLDFQLGPDIDRAAYVRSENVEPFVRAMLGDDVAFQKVWYSVYTFQCRRMSRFAHGRVIFAGDSAHVVSPFGARGCNGGLADADNLCWKLDLVLRGKAGPALLESYNHEAIVAADENILHSSRATDFMTPKSPLSCAFRDAVLELATEAPFARSFINSGRLSTPASYPASPLNTPDADRWNGGVPPGSPAIDAPMGSEWLLGSLGGKFVVLTDGWSGPGPEGVSLLDISRLKSDVLRARYDLGKNSGYLFRPDQYVAARWRSPTSESIANALARAKGITP